MVSPLVTAEWLKANLASVRTLDAGYHLTGVDRDPEAEFAAARLPGACRFDINRVADQTNPLPHMIPQQPNLPLPCPPWGSVMRTMS